MSERSLEGKCVLLGITGGIAAYKSASLASALVKAGASVYCVMTKNATRFISPLTFETLTNHPVALDTFERPATWEVEHIALAKRAQLAVIAPASANVIAKLAHGIADDMLTTVLLATRAPILVAPAMNTGMWDNAATRHNIEVLAGRGASFAGPGAGRLACGDTGEGRMAEPEEIFEKIERMLCGARDLAGRHVLVTAGPTREPIDPVRYISNHSSGKMGFALAEAARARGARVTLVCGPVTLPTPAGVERVDVESTLDLYEQLIARAPECDAVIQAAAPADYRAARVETQKIKKQAGQPMTLELTENPDIAAALGKAKRAGQVLVAFAAETQQLAENARAKLARKNADLIVANDVTQPDAGFFVDTNRVILYDRQGGEQALPLLSKREVADRILDRVAEMLPAPE